MILVVSWKKSIVCGATWLVVRALVMWRDLRDMTFMLMANQPSTQTNPRTVNHFMNPYLGSLLASRFTLTDVDAIFVAVSCTTPHSNVLVVVTGSALQLDRRFKVTGSTMGKVYCVNYLKTKCVGFWNVFSWEHLTAYNYPCVDKKVWPVSLILYVSMHDVETVL